MRAWEIAAGLIGTVALTTVVRVASELHLTRLDLALILGTLVTKNRRRARACGYLFHAVLGVVFAAAYGALFRQLGWSTWWLGALFGAVHALFLSTVVINILLPAIHPLMGTFETAANEYALIEPPGFFMLNYGRATVIVTLVSHIIFGAIVGAMYRG